MLTDLVSLNDAKTLCPRHLFSLKRISIFAVLTEYTPFYVVRTHEEKVRCWVVHTALQRFARNYFSGWTRDFPVERKSNLSLLQVRQ